MLYFNTNKPHSFFFIFLQNTSCIRKPQVISRGGAHPLHPTPRSAPAKDDIKVIYSPNMLENHRTVNHYGIQLDETINILHRICGGKPPQPAFNTDELDPAFDYDFNSVEDDI